MSAPPSSAAGPQQGQMATAPGSIFTMDQLNVLRNQILAFRLVKVCLQAAGLQAHP